MKKLYFLLLCFTFTLDAGRHRTERKKIKQSFEKDNLHDAVEDKVLENEHSEDEQEPPIASDDELYEYPCLCRGCTPENSDDEQEQENKNDESQESEPEQDSQEDEDEQEPIAQMQDPHDFKLLTDNQIRYKAAFMINSGFVAVVAMAYFYNYYSG